MMQYCPHRTVVRGSIRCALIEQEMGGFPFGIAPAICTGCQQRGTPREEAPTSFRNEYTKEAVTGFLANPLIGKYIEDWDEYMERLLDIAGVEESSLPGWERVRTRWRQAHITTATTHTGKDNGRAETCRRCHLRGGGPILRCGAAPCRDRHISHITPAMLSVEGVHCPVGKF